MNFLETLKHFRNYFSARIVSKALAFISIPVLTRLLTKAEYGTWSVFLSYVGVFTVILSVNSYTSLGRYFYEQKKDFQEFFGTNIVYSIATFALSSLFILFLRTKISNFLGIEPRGILFLIPIVGFAIIESFFDQLYQGKKKSKIIARTNVIRTYIGFGLSVCFILMLDTAKYWGMIYSITLTGLVFSIIYLIWLRNEFVIHFNWNHVRYILKFSLPLIPYYLSGIILAQFDRIMINSIEGAESAGLYSLAYNIGMIMFIIVNSLNQAWTPEYFQCMNEENYIKHDSDVTKLFRIFVAAAIGLVFFGKEIGVILAKDNFHEALIIVPVITTGYLFSGMSDIYARNIGYAKKTIHSSIVVLAAGTLNVILNSLAIPVYGYKSASVTSMLSYIFMFLLSWIISKFVLKQHSTSLKIFLLPISLFFVAVALYYCVFLGIDRQVLLIVIKILCFGGFTGILLYRYRKEIFQMMKPSNL